VEGAGVDLAWLSERIWGQHGSTPALRRARRSGADEVAERYIVVPSPARARYLLPEDRRGAWSCLIDGRATRSPAAVRRRVLVGAAARIGLAGVLWRHRLEVSLGPDHDPSLREYLAELTDGPVVLAVSVRPVGPYRTPVVVAARPGGGVVAYVKLATDPLTASNVETEASRLSALADDRDVIRVPQVLAVTRWRGFPVLVTAPMPGDLARYDPRTGAPPAEVSARVAGAGEHGVASLASGPILRGLRRRLAAAGAQAPSELSEGLDGLLEALEAVGELPLAHGLWHGDWSPWNLARRGDELWAWDWEFSRPDVPVGLDLPHFHLQQAFIAEGRSLASSVERAHGAAAPALASLGHDEERRSVIRASHVAEIVLRALEASAVGVRPNQRVTDEGPAVLRQERRRLEA
jgi:hypothetical protein